MLCIAYWGRDATKIIPELSEVHPTYLPSVPRIFEKLYTFVTSPADPELVAQATQIGLKVRELEGAAGQMYRTTCVPAPDQADNHLFKSVPRCVRRPVARGGGTVRLRSRRRSSSSSTPRHAGDERSG